MAEQEQTKGDGAAVEARLFAALTALVLVSGVVGTGVGIWVGLRPSNAICTDGSACAFLVAYVLITAPIGAVVGLVAGSVAVKRIVVSEKRHVLKHVRGSAVALLALPTIGLILGFLVGSEIINDLSVTQTESQRLLDLSAYIGALVGLAGGILAARSTYREHKARLSTEQEPDAE